MTSIGGNILFFCNLYSWVNFTYDKIIGNLVGLASEWLTIVSVRWLDSLFACRSKEGDVLHIGRVTKEIERNYNWTAVVQLFRTKLFLMQNRQIISANLNFFDDRLGKFWTFKIRIHKMFECKIKESFQLHFNLLEAENVLQTWNWKVFLWFFWWFAVFIVKPVKPIREFNVVWESPKLYRILLGLTSRSIEKVVAPFYLVFYKKSQKYDCNLHVFFSSRSLL